LAVGVELVRASLLAKLLQEPKQEPSKSKSFASRLAPTRAKAKDKCRSESFYSKTKNLKPKTALATNVKRKT
jgi:hypothetical protein